MKQTIALKLETTPDQFDALIETMEAFNRGCMVVGQLAFEKRSANKIALQPFVYGQLRKEFGLSSQMAVRAIGKACDAFKSARALHSIECEKIKHGNRVRAKKGIKPLPLPTLEAPTFDLHGAIVYDHHLFGIKDIAHVSLRTLQGRIIVAMRYGAYQEARLALQKGQADLILRDGVFYLHICIELPTPPTTENSNGHLGIDLGIAEVAVDSLGNSYSGNKIKTCRKRLREHRRQLQKKHTNSSKKRLRKVSRRQSRFVRDCNHCISKWLVSTAAALQKALALEDLSGIRDRGTVSKHMRWLLGNWAFHQLREFILYKAVRAGIGVVFVDPTYTSRTCSCCGYCHKKNRKSQSQFECINCGLTMNADANSALNVEARADLSCSLLLSVPTSMPIDTQERLKSKLRHFSACSS